jgi:quinol monooxygenase YgiN
MIHVIATIHLVPGRRAEFLTHFHKLVPMVLAEKGCLEYGPAIDLQTPVTSDPPVRDDVVTVIEKWESVEALQDHLAAPHMDRFRQAVKDLVVGVEIRVLQPA